MNYGTRNCRRNSDPTSLEKSTLKTITQEPNDTVSFKGKAGFYTGVILGGGAIAALAFVFMAPVIASGAALVGALSGVAGDSIEEGIKDKLKLISPTIFEPLQKLKKDVLHNINYRLNAQDVLTVLSIAATTNPILENLFDILSSLKGIEAHSTVVLGYEDAKVLKSLEINVSQEAILKND
jgi:uncharacterized protein (UPF0371 family)